MDTPPQETEVFFHISDGPGQREKPFRILQPDILRRRSVEFRRLIDEAAIEQNKKKITLELDHTLGIDRHAVEYVLENLQRDAAQPGGDCKLEALARHCTVLWKYKCDPYPFKILWNSTQPRSSHSNTLSMDQQSNASPSRTPRCWRRRKSITTCRQLITVAIVLGLGNILEEEIKVAVWGSSKEVKIPLTLVSDIQSIRKEELAKLFDSLYEGILAVEDDNEKLAKQIREDLKQDGLGSLRKRWDKNSEVLRDMSPCEFLRGVESVMVGPQDAQTQVHPSLSSRSQARSRDVPSINLPNLISKWKKAVINGIEVPGDGDKAKIDEVLDSLEKFIEKRQQDRVADLMEWRDLIVGGWKEELREPDSSTEQGQT